MRDYTNLDTLSRRQLLRRFGFAAAAAALPVPALAQSAKKLRVVIVGGGLAGSEAAWQIARAGVPVILHEMRPVRMTDAHQTDGLAELVCSNSFRSDDMENNAVGLLHEEMRRAGSLFPSCTKAHSP